MSKQEKKPLFREHLKKEIIGLIWLAIGAYLLLCLLTFNSADPSFNNNLHPDRISNFGGVIGSHMTDLLYQGFGIPILLVPCAFLLFAWKLLKFRDLHVKPYKVGAFLLLILSLDGLFALHISAFNFLGETIHRPGGAVGAILGGALEKYLNTSGATIFLLVFLIVALMLVARFSVVLFLEGVLARLAEFLEKRREAHEARKLQKAKEKGLRIETAPKVTPPEKTKKVPPKKQEKKKSKKDIEGQEAFDFLEPTGTYHMPQLSLLDHEGGEPAPIDKDALTMNARILEKKLKDFGVEGEVVEVKPGPVVTMYEFLPAPGVKVSKIAGLSDDLTMALSALSIRIVAPIPGRGVVGIEIPNKDRETVYLKDIFQSSEFQNSRSRLPMALGKDIFGHTIVSDLVKMPHLLVAGATGSGKSVSVNTMILSLLYRSSPEDVRLIMIDPKMLELSIYEGIPHLLLPVVTNPKKAALALAWAVREMERRYKLMADKGVRNIDGYNKKLVKEEKEAAAGRKSKEDPQVKQDDFLEEELPEIEIAEDEELEHGHLPQLVIIVDELADLMMVAGRDIEESVARLAQMARAAGIHLILATQRPSVDVITGLIKANFPTRISFKVFSRTDSRTILDSMGAESLLGMGDMLYLPPGTGALQRVHGAFVSEVEVQRVVDFLGKQGQPEYDKTILETPASGEGGPGGFEEEEDEKWDEALALVANKQQASISMIQRHLRIGYNRAARMIEKMEQEGIIGPSDGTSRPREVFLNKIENP
ncbi:MAG: cell division protein FtsK [Desulfuromonas sp.]|nr:MAG: cell division protein FtsK [Desulfuromonas sp.]